MCVAHRDPWSLVQEASGHATSAMDAELSEWESHSSPHTVPGNWSGVRLLGSSLWSFLWESLGGEFAGMSRVPSYRTLEQRSRRGGDHDSDAEENGGGGGGGGDDSSGSADGPVGAAEPVWSQWSGVSDPGEDSDDDEPGSDEGDSSDDGGQGNRR